MKVQNSSEKDSTKSIRESAESTVRKIEEWNKDREGSDSEEGEELEIA